MFHYSEKRGNNGMEKIGLVTPTPGHLLITTTFYTCIQ